jgi:peptidoglycan hydrolase-like protein with peptidoglycan-binding domain
LKVQKALSNSGDYIFDIAKETSGKPSPGLGGAVRAFQKSKGLKVDGLLNPDGPTIKALTAALFTPDGARADAPQAPATKSGAALGEAADGPKSKAPGKLSAKLPTKRPAKGNPPTAQTDANPPTSATAAKDDAPGAGVIPVKTGDADTREPAPPKEPRNPVAPRPPDADKSGEPPAAAQGKAPGREQGGDADPSDATARSRCRSTRGMR